MIYWYQGNTLFFRITTVFSLIFCYWYVRTLSLTHTQTCICLSLYFFLSLSSFVSLSVSCSPLSSFFISSSIVFHSLCLSFFPSLLPVYLSCTQTHTPAHSRSTHKSTSVYLRFRFCVCFCLHTYVHNR